MENWAEEDLAALGNEYRKIQREKAQRFAKEPEAQKQAHARIKREGYSLLRSEPLDQGGHCTYWHRPDEGDVVQIRPDGSQSAFDHAQWRSIERELDGQ